MTEVNFAFLFAFISLESDKKNRENISINAEFLKLFSEPLELTL